MWPWEEAKKSAVWPPPLRLGVDGDEKAQHQPLEHEGVALQRRHVVGHEAEVGVVGQRVAAARHKVLHHLPVPGHQGLGQQPHPLLRALVREPRTLHVHALLHQRCTYSREAIEEHLAFCLSSAWLDRYLVGWLEGSACRLVWLSLV